MTRGEIYPLLERHGFRNSRAEDCWTRGRPNSSRMFMAMLDGTTLTLDQVRAHGGAEGSIDIADATSEEVDAWMHDILTK